MDTIKFEKKNAQVIAHRGVCGIEPENTISSFVAACNRSYLAVETDVHITLDGEFVLIHDDSTGRVAGDDVEISKVTYSYLKNLILNDRIGSAPYNEDQTPCSKERSDLRIPKLSEYVNLCKKYDKKCVIEIKNEKKNFDTSTVKRMVEIVRKIDYLHNVIFISFDAEPLTVIREMCPNQELELLASEYDDALMDAMNKYSLDIDIRWTAVTKELIEKVHANGHRINCWTCNDKETAEKFDSWGIDYITTNILE